MTGDGQVERVKIAQVDKQFQPIPGTERILEADTVWLAIGLNPMTELVWTAGCKFCFIPAFGGHVPMHDGNMETTVPGLYVAGDVTGVEEASSAMEEGNLAGVCAAHALGLLTDEQAADKKAEINARLDALRAAARLNSSSSMPCRPNKEGTIMWGDPNKLSRDNLQKEDINPGVQYTGVPSQDELSRCPGLAIPHEYIDRVRSMKRLPRRD